MHVMLRKNLPPRLLAILFMSLLSLPVHSSSTPGTYTLPWPKTTEQLTYRSCGYADACWTAQLRVRRSKRLKAVLRCDCNSLLVVYPVKTAERELQNSCSAINGSNDKMEAISQTMQRVIDAEKTKK